MAAFGLGVSAGLCGIDQTRAPTLILNTNEKDSWFWYIPLHDNTVSVGVIGDIKYLCRDGQATRRPSFCKS